jgi:two-component system LytT family response regulator
MPEMSGLEVVATIGVEEMPAVVFVTAYDEYAVAAFELEAVDYVTKPVEPERLGLALDRAARRLAAERHEMIGRLLERTGERAAPPTRLLVRDGDRAYFVPLSEVTHLGARGNYVELHTAGGRHLVRDTLARLEETLDPARFVRIHRSTVVNLDRVRELQPAFHGDWVVILDDGTRLRLSRRYRDRVLRDR